MGHGFKTEVIHNQERSGRQSIAVQKTEVNLRIGRHLTIGELHEQFTEVMRIVFMKWLWKDVAVGTVSELVARNTDTRSQEKSSGCGASIPCLLHRSK